MHSPPRSAGEGRSAAIDAIATPEYGDGNGSPGRQPSEGCDGSRQGNDDERGHDAGEEWLGQQNGDDAWDGGADDDGAGPLTQRARWDGEESEPLPGVLSHHGGGADALGDVASPALRKDSLARRSPQISV